MENWWKSKSKVKIWNVKIEMLEIWKIILKRDEVCLLNEFIEMIKIGKLRDWRGHLKYKRGNTNNT